MLQLSFFPELQIDNIRKEVIAEFPRLPSEPYEEWREFIRLEVDERLKRLIKKIPNYNNQNLQSSLDYKIFNQKMLKTRLEIADLAIKQGLPF